MLKLYFGRAKARLLFFFLMCSNYILTELNQGFYFFSHVLKFYFDRAKARLFDAGEKVVVAADDGTGGPLEEVVSVVYCGHDRDAPSGVLGVMAIFPGEW